jgi:hypothetical protein
MTLGVPRTPPPHSMEVVMNAVPFVIAMALFVFGMWLFSVAPEVVGFEAILFFGGIVCVALALAVPVSLLGHRESAV